MSAELHSWLTDVAVRAQRQLDGMTVNRDGLARDTLKLVSLVRAMKTQADNAARSSRGDRGGLTAEMDRMFQDIFGSAFKETP